MRHFLRAILIIAAAIAAHMALAQGEQQGISQRLNAAASAVQDIAKSVRDDNPGDAALLQLRGRLEPVSSQVQVIIDDLQPDLDAARQRIEQLGPKPAANAPPESAETAKQRADEQKAFDEIDAHVRRARVIALNISQTGADITNARRALLMGEIFKRSSSALNPLLWYEAGRALPRSYNAAQFIVSNWVDRINLRLQGARLLRFVGAVLILCAGYLLLRRLARAWLGRNPREEKPAALEKALVALWTVLAVALLPIAFAIGFVEILKFFDLLTPRIEPLINALVDAVKVVAVSAGLARGMLAPNRPAWRVIGVHDLVARQFTRMAVLFASIVATLRVFETVAVMTAAQLEVSVAMRALGTVIAAAILGHSLFTAARSARALDYEFGPSVDKRRDWFALWRFAIWLAIVTVLAANVFGYVNFANFVTGQIMWVTFLLAGGALLHTLGRETIARVMQAESPFAIAASTALGIQQSSLKQVSILLSGLVSLLVYFAGLMLIVAPWGVESSSVVETMRAAFFGFSFGAINFSLSGVVLAIALFLLGFLATRAFQRWLEGNYLPSTQLDAGLQHSITTSAGYVGVLAAIGLPFAYLGFNFEKLAIIAGALSLGIGFGLQSIVSNFVSGLILLWERAVKVGDWVIVGSEQGIVKRINVRSTEIETFERQTVIVPNSNLISGVVKNWVRTDRSGRLNVEIGVDYSSDPERVRDILLACAADHPHVAKEPAPSVAFTAFGDSSLNFDLRCFVDDVDHLGATRSDLRFEIFCRFKAAGVNIPYPRNDITVRNLDELIANAQRPREGAAPAVREEDRSSGEETRPPSVR